MRVIDYALTRHCDAQASAHAFHGSDHRVVVFVVRQGGQLLRVGLWNMQRDRPVRDVVDQVVDLFALYQLDALGLCEANDYVHELRARRAGIVVLTGSSVFAGSRETALVVRDGVDVTGSWTVKLTSAGWVTVRGGKTAPKYAPTALLDGWLRVTVVHTPPSCRFPRGNHGPVGPVRRVAAFVALTHRLRRFLRRRPAGQAQLVVGDWNATPAARGPASPAWLARVSGGRIVAPHKGTHR
jgi:hypothetical protein